MRGLSLFLEKINKSLNKSQLLKNAAILAVERSTGIRLSENEVLIENGVLEIKTTPSRKSEIMLKEETIIFELKTLNNFKIARVLYK